MITYDHVIVPCGEGFEKEVVRLGEKGYLVASIIQAQEYCLEDTKIIMSKKFINRGVK